MRKIVDYDNIIYKIFCEMKEVEQLYFITADEKEDKIIFTLDETDSYKRKLILHTSKENFIDNFDLIGFSDAQIVKEENCYKLICVAENYETETSVPIGIFFDQATTEIDVYRADRRDFNDNPWESLAFMASDILEKDYLGAKFFNQKEQDLMPLLKELRALSVWAPLYDEETPDFEILKQYLQKHNAIHLVPLIDKAGKREKGKLVNPLLFSRLTSKLNETSCESLWRELYELVVETQEGYIDKILSYNQTKLNKIRLQIEKKFHNLGYEGRYPTFSKKGAIKGIRLEESYNQSYFVGAEKNVEHIIECEAVCSVQDGHILPLCGIFVEFSADAGPTVQRKLFHHLFDDRQLDVLAPCAAPVVSGQERDDVFAVVEVRVSVIELIGDLRAVEGCCIGILIEVHIPAVYQLSFAFCVHAVRGGLAVCCQHVVRRVVCVRSGCEVICTLVQDVGLCAVSVIRSHVALVHLHGEGFGFARGEDRRLAEAYELNGGLFDLVVDVILCIRGGKVDLHGFLAVHVAGIGNGNGDVVALLAVFVHTGFHLHIAVLEGGVREAVTEGESNLLAVLLGIVAGIALTHNGVKVTGLVIFVANVDAFLIDHIGRGLIGHLTVKIGILQCQIVVHGRGGKIVVAIDVHERAGRIHNTGQNIGHGVGTADAQTADPQAGADVIVVQEVHL